MIGREKQKSSAIVRSNRHPNRFHQLEIERDRVETRWPNTTNIISWDIIAVVALGETRKARVMQQHCVSMIIETANEVEG